MDSFEQARGEFETAMRMDPQQDETPYLYGRACFQRGELKLAAELFERACRSRENHEACYFAAQTQTALGHEQAALAAYRLALRAVEKGSSSILTMPGPIPWVRSVYAGWETAAAAWNGPNGR